MSATIAPLVARPAWKALVAHLDSFDQWGVELVKELAQRILPELKDIAEPKLSHDSSITALIRRYRQRKGN